MLLESTYYFVAFFVKLETKSARVTPLLALKKQTYFNSTGRKKQILPTTHWSLEVGPSLVQPPN